MTRKSKVLIIDDEPNNLRALKMDMEDEDYEVLTAEDGMIGWDILIENKDEINTILLDRMMPNMDSMEFLTKLKATDSLKDIPVIMQTAAAEKEQVVESIQAGAYYYLIKPYDKDVMLSVVAASIEGYVQAKIINDELKTFKNKLNLVKENNFEVFDLDEVHYLATFLSNFFPDSEKVVVGIIELITNAVEHGNLGISYTEKSQLNKQGTWLEEVNRRLKLPKNKNKRVLVKYIKDEKTITLIIKDEGNGFNWHEYMEILPERATDSHGRGIALSRMTSFDSMEYIGNGNEVVCKVNLPS